MDEGCENDGIIVVVCDGSEWEHCTAGMRSEFWSSGIFCFELQNFLIVGDRYVYFPEVLLGSFSGSRMGFSVPAHWRSQCLRRHRCFIGSNILFSLDESLLFLEIWSIQIYSQGMGRIISRRPTELIKFIQNFALFLEFLCVLHTCENRLWYQPSVVSRFVPNIGENMWTHPLEPVAGCVCPFPNCEARKSPPPLSSWYSYECAPITISRSHIWCDYPWRSSRNLMHSDALYDHLETHFRELAPMSPLGYFPNTLRVLSKHCESDMSFLVNLSSKKKKDFLDL